MSCLSCQTTAMFISNTCVCSDGYFIDQGQCLLCPSTCLFCTDAFTCTVCFPNSHSQLDNGACLCMEGYRGIPPLCQACGQNCVKCESFCIQCYSGHFNLGGECYAQCPRGYREVEGLCVLEPSWNLPFTADLSLLWNQTLQLAFSAPLVSELLETDFNLTANFTPLLYTFQVWELSQLSRKLIKYNSEIDVSCIQQPDRYSPQPTGNKGTAACYFPALFPYQSIHFNTCAQHQWSGSSNSSRLCYRDSSE